MPGASLLMARLEMHFVGFRALLTALANLVPDAIQLLQTTSGHPAAAVRDNDRRAPTSRLPQNDKKLIARGPSCGTAEVSFFLALRRSHRAARILQMPQP